MRYIVFAYNTYYPAGGINDIMGTADTLERASMLYWREQGNWDHLEIYDNETGDEAYPINRNKLKGDQ